MTRRDSRLALRTLFSRSRATKDSGAAVASSLPSTPETSSSPLAPGSHHDPPLPSAPLGLPPVATPTTATLSPFVIPPEQPTVHDAFVSEKTPSQYGDSNSTTTSSPTQSHASSPFLPSSLPASMPSSIDISASSSSFPSSLPPPPLPPLPPKTHTIIPHPHHPPPLTSDTQTTTTTTSYTPNHTHAAPKRSSLVFPSTPATISATPSSSHVSASGHHVTETPTKPVATSTPPSYSSPLVLPPLTPLQTRTTVELDARPSTPTPPTARTSHSSSHHGSWHPPPLFKAYPQAMKHGPLLTISSNVETLLRWHEKKKLEQEEAGDEDHHHHHHHGALATSSSSSSLTSSRTRPRRAGSLSSLKLECARKIFVLVTAGYVLQYASEGAAHRLPERMLRLGKLSAAFASDAIPGRHAVLHVAATMDARGMPVVESRSLFSRIYARGAEKRLSSNMLLVFDQAEEMLAWMTVIRREIELLGGRKRVTETGELLSEQQQQPTTTSSAYETQPSQRNTVEQAHRGEKDHPQGHEAGPTGPLLDKPLPAVSRLSQDMPRLSENRISRSLDLDGRQSWNLADQASSPSTAQSPTLAPTATTTPPPSVPLLPPPTPATFTQPVTTEAEEAAPPFTPCPPFHPTPPLPALAGYAPAREDRSRGPSSHTAARTAAYQSLDGKNLSVDTTPHPLDTTAKFAARRASLQTMNAFARTSVRPDSILVHPQDVPSSATRPGKFVPNFSMPHGTRLYPTSPVLPQHQQEQPHQQPQQPQQEQQQQQQQQQQPQHSSSFPPWNAPTTPVYGDGEEMDDDEGVDVSPPPAPPPLHPLIEHDLFLIRSTQRTAAAASSSSSSQSQGPPPPPSFLTRPVMAAAVPESKASPSITTSFYPTARTDHTHLRLTTPHGHAPTDLTSPPSSLPVRTPPGLLPQPQRQGSHRTGTTKSTLVSTAPSVVVPLPTDVVLPPPPAPPPTGPLPALPPAKHRPRRSRSTFGRFGVDRGESPSSSSSEGAHRGRGRSGSESNGGGGGGGGSKRASMNLSLRDAMSSVSSKRNSRQQQPPPWAPTHEEAYLPGRPMGLSGSFGPPPPFGPPSTAHTATTTATSSLRNGTTRVVGPPFSPPPPPSSYTPIDTSTDTNTSSPPTTLLSPKSTTTTTALLNRRSMSQIPDSASTSRKAFFFS